MEGEGYFDVIRNPQAPFRISTKDATIEVLGTSFNVRAYSTQENVEVVVSDGTVALSAKDDPDNTLILDKGTTGIFNPTNNYLLKKNNSDPNFLSWKTRRIVFENDSLSWVLKTIGKVYDREIVLRDEDIGHCSLTVTFEDQTLESVLKVIESTLNIKIKDEEGTIIVTGDGC
jgi:ferric-dicitrate binding protein FerR (iron transport regulator)